MYVVEKLKQSLGLGFAASEMGVIESVESMCKTMQEIKAALGLPPEADAQQIMDAIEARKGLVKEPAKPEAAPEAAEKVSWFKSLFKP